MEGDDKCFTDKLSFIWSRYYNPREEKQSSSLRVMHTIFHPLPYVDLPKVSVSAAETRSKWLTLCVKQTGCQFFVRASQILQSCQRQKGVLAGCVLYNKELVCSYGSCECMEHVMCCVCFLVFCTRSSLLLSPRNFLFVQQELPLRLKFIALGW